MNEPGTQHINAPSAPDEAPQRTVGGSEVSEVIGKKVLLQILAVREAERIGITATSAEVLSAATGFRNMFGLSDDQEFQAWLDHESISTERFERFMYQFATVANVESFYAAEIERQLRDMSRIDAVRSRTR